MFKKLIALLFVALLAFSLSLTVSANAPADFDPFAGDTAVNVVYLGGSITVGSGASDEGRTSWVAQVGEYLQNTYGQNRIFNNYNAGIGGTGSGLGMMRLKDEVIAHKPDLVFVEFAVNDSGAEAGLWQMESIILTLQQMDTTPYIVFVLTTADYLTGSDYQQYHKAVAAHYGIPVIDLDAAVKADSTVKLSELLGDGVHPNDTGYAFYAKTIIEALQDPASWVRPAKQDTRLSEKSRIVDVKPVSFRDMLFSGVEGTDYTITDEGIVLLTPGTSFTGYFQGDAIVLKDINFIGGGSYKVSVDGVNVGSKDTYNAPLWDPTARILHYGVLCTDLFYDFHEITVTMLESTEPVTDPQVIISTVLYNAYAPDGSADIAEETSPTETDQPPASDSRGLSIGAVIGIIAAIGVAVAALAVIAVKLTNKKK